MKKLIPILFLLIVAFKTSAQPQQLYNNYTWFTSTVVPYNVGGGHGLVNGTLNVPQGMFIYGEFDGFTQPPSKPFSFDSLVGGSSAFTKQNVVLMTSNHKIVWYDIPIAVYSMCFTPDSSAIWFYGHPDQNGHSICIYNVANNTYSMTGRIADSVGPGGHGFISMIDDHTAFIGGNMQHFGADVSSYAFLYTDSDVVTPLRGRDSVPAAILGMAGNGEYTYFTFRNNAGPINYSHLARYNSAARSIDAVFSDSIPQNFEMNRLLLNGNDLYAVGYDPSMVSSIWRFDLTTLHSSLIATPGTPVTSLSFDGRYIEASGEFTNITSTVTTNGIGTYDPQTNVWSQKYNNYSNGGNIWFEGLDAIDSNLIAVDAIGNIMTTSTFSANDIHQISNNASMLIYPNPAKNIINIKGESGQIILTDITGKVLSQTTTQTGDVSINTTSFDRGIYFLYNNAHACKIILE